MVCGDYWFCVFFVGHTINEIDEIWQIDRRGLAIHHNLDSWTLAQGAPLGRQKVKGVNVKICNAFLIRRLAECDEIWHDYEHWCVASRKWWSTFSRSRNFRQRIYRTLLVRGWRNLTWLWVWLIDTYFPNLLNFGPGVPRYHAATCTFTDARVIPPCGSMGGCWVYFV